MSGTGEHLIDGVSYPIAPNAFFLLTPANVHEIHAPGAEVITVMFQSEYSGGFFSFPQQSPQRSPYFAFSGREERLIRELMEEMYATYQNDSTYAMMVLHCVLHKLQTRNAAESRAMPLTVQNVIAYILENFRKSITLESTAVHFGFSAPYLSDFFQQQTGRNFKSYLDGVRFSHAQNLLAFTDLPICEINVCSGFSDYANFARRFKERTGMTPTEYRKRARENGALKK